jgi:transcriptional regulator with XRE-family HTH domain
MRNETVKSIGDYIREQREQARISMRQLAQQAGVSNPYLSQIERGLRKPSADILQQIAKGLRISAEALYVQAGILEDRPADTGVRSALLADAELSERQKQVLMEIYESFRKENAAIAEAQAAEVAAQAAEVEAAAEVAAAEAAIAEVTTTATTTTAATATAATATAATTEAAAEAADDGRPSRTSWSAATAEAEQAEPSGNADDVPGQNVPPIG